MKIIISIYLLLLPLLSLSQANRIKDDNAIVWSQLFASYEFRNNWLWLAEYQWRRTNGIKNGQQNLLRTAIQYTVNNNLSIAVGYGWIETFKYGDFPVATGNSFPEHRSYQQLQLKNLFGKLDVMQRFRVEQRWIGKIKAGTDKEVEDWIYSNRLRHLIKLQHPLIKSSLYGSIGNEVFINAGKNIGANTFDQNRILFALGYKFSGNISVEIGYINQTLFQGRRVDENIVVQDNNGLTATAIINL